MTRFCTGRCAENWTPGSGRDADHCMGRLRDLGVADRRAVASRSRSSGAQLVSRPVCKACHRGARLNRRRRGGRGLIACTRKFPVNCREAVLGQLPHAPTGPSRWCRRSRTGRSITWRSARRIWLAPSPTRTRRSPPAPTGDRRAEGSRTKGKRPAHWPVPGGRAAGQRRERPTSCFWPIARAAHLQRGGPQSRPHLTAWRARAGELLVHIVDPNRLWNRTSSAPASRRRTT